MKITDRGSLYKTLTQANLLGKMKRRKDGKEELPMVVSIRQVRSQQDFSDLIDFGMQDIEMIAKDLKRIRDERRAAYEESHLLLFRSLFSPEETLADQLEQLTHYLSELPEEQTDTEHPPVVSPKKNGALARWRDKFKMRTSFSIHPSRSAAVTHIDRVVLQCSQDDYEVIDVISEHEEDLNVEDYMLENYLERETERGKMYRMEKRERKKKLKKLRGDIDKLEEQKLRMQRLSSVDTLDSADQLKDLDLKIQQEKTTQGIIKRQHNNILRQIELLHIDLEIKERERKQREEQEKFQVEVLHREGRDNLNPWTEHLEKTITKNVELNKKRDHLESLLEKAKERHRPVMHSLNMYRKEYREITTTLLHHTVIPESKVLRPRHTINLTTALGSLPTFLRHKEEETSVNPLALSGQFPEVEGEGGDLQLIKRCKPEHSGSVRSILYHVNTIWAGCGDGTIRLWDAVTGYMIYNVQGHDSCVFDMKVVNEMVWTTSRCGQIHLWSRKGPFDKLILMKRLRGKVPIYCSYLLDVEGKVWGGHMDGSITVWSSEKPYRVLKEFHEGKTIGCMMRRADRVWIGTEDNIVICDASTTRPKASLVGHTATITCMISVGPCEVWSSSMDQTIRCWNSERENCMRIIEMDTKIFCLREIKGEGLVLVGCRDDRIALYSCSTYERVQQARGAHMDAVVSFEVDKKGRVWSASWDNTICIWRQGRYVEETKRNRPRSWNDVQQM
ncbi:NB-ARC domain-containing protein [Planoprotostelium fungivorum]|uniref:NB-ARC domain-containing protein n=1 Tax=Planoprotostelium fungivorum TaxID=1890364 RepID=A0A2P6N313_9EUKA|nr:NB-ARC domain-containing protein [Planoprotostelium fungivorum]